MRTLWQDPEYRQHQSAILAEKARSPKGRADRIRAGKASKLRHIPEAYRDAYRALTIKGIRAAEAVVMVREQIARDEKRARAPRPRLGFEELLAAVAAGTVTVCERIQPPERVYDFSITGAQM